MDESNIAMLVHDLQSLDNLNIMDEINVNGSIHLKNGKTNKVYHIDNKSISSSEISDSTDDTNISLNSKTEETEDLVNTVKYKKLSFKQVQNKIDSYFDSNHKIEIIAKEKGKLGVIQKII